MATFTRGFTGRAGLERDPRLPPGQYDAGQSWPVLTAEPTPHLDTGSWSLTVDGLVQRPTTWSWEEIRAVPASGFTGDIHCVTSWSKLGISFTGVSVDTLLEAAMPLAAATHVLAYSRTGYTTNLPLPDVTGGRAWVVWEVDGQPLPREHGAPARLVVPHLYFWMSAKWIGGLRLLDREAEHPLSHRQTRRATGRVLDLVTLRGDRRRPTRGAARGRPGHRLRRRVRSRPTE